MAKPFCSIAKTPQNSKAICSSLLKGSKKILKLFFSIHILPLWVKAKKEVITIRIAIMGAGLSGSHQLSDNF
jgi:hypothetical protein